LGTERYEKYWGESYFPMSGGGERESVTSDDLEKAKRLSREKLKEKINDLVNIFKDNVCPLHINGKCSVYEVRPAKCRAFGNFIFAFNDRTQFLSCASDIEKMYNYLKQKRTKQLALPYWNSVEMKLEKIAKDKDDHFDVNIIPLWLRKEI
jgi:Fe-S-cluster containining protein